MMWKRLEPTGNSLEDDVAATRFEFTGKCAGPARGQG